MSEKSCSTFYCDIRGGRYCCAFCPDPCKNRCLNHPDRCKLAKEGSPHKKNCQHLSEEAVAEIRRLISEGKLTGEKIAEKIGCSTATIAWHRQRMRMEAERHGKAK